MPGFVHPWFLVPLTYPGKRDGYKNGVIRAGPSGAHLQHFVVSHSRRW